jgi:hypothetical protein
MQLADPIYTHGMTDHQRAWFYAEYERARKDEVIAVLLAIFLGGFGVHHFYLRRNGLGILYLVVQVMGDKMARRNPVMQMLLLLAKPRLIGDNR